MTDCLGRHTYTQKNQKMTNTKFRTVFPWRREVWPRRNTQASEVLVIFWFLSCIMAQRCCAVSLPLFPSFGPSLPAPLHVGIYVCIWHTHRHTPAYVFLCIHHHNFSCYTGGPASLSAPSLALWPSMEPLAGDSGLACMLAPRTPLKHENHWAPTCCSSFLPSRCTHLEHWSRPPLMGRSTLQWLLPQKMVVIMLQGDLKCYSGCKVEV